MACQAFDVTFWRGPAFPVMKAHAMRPKVLLTLGRLPKALELARALHGVGCEVLIAEPYGAHLSRPSRSVSRSFSVPAPAHDPEGYLSALMEIASSEGVDHVIPISEEALFVARLADRLPPGVKLHCAAEETLAGLHDKGAFANLAQSYGLSVPETFEAGSVEAAAFCAAHDYIIKPRHGCSGGGLSLRRAGDRLSPEDRHAGNLVQRRIYGRHLSTLSVVEKGREVGTVIYEGTVLSGTVATCFKRVEDAPSVLNWVSEFIAHTDYEGFIAFDFIVDANGEAFALECNPRLTSGAHFIAPEDLALAALGRAPASLSFKPVKRMQEGHTTLTEAYASVLRPREMLRRFGELVRARDVLWSWSDPAPFFLMTPMSWPILKRVLFGGMSFGEAATHDIAVGDVSPASLPHAEGEPASRPFSEMRRETMPVGSEHAL